MHSNFWEKLSEGGDKKAQQCGWLKDKYGASWQVIPIALRKLFGGADSEKSQRAMTAMLQMKKIDIAELARREPVGHGDARARVTTLKSVAAAALAEPRLFDRAGSIDETVARLRAIRGIGDWTAHYIAMRACGDPDAFPAGDVGLLRGAADTCGRRPTPGELLARAEAWRPWRAYAAHHLWAADSSR